MSSKHPERIPTDQLKQQFGSPTLQATDLRTMEAYNGWSLQGETRGGHITGDRSLPSKWLNYLDWIEMVHHKEILPEHEVIIYGCHTDVSGRVAERFIRSGYRHVKINDDFLSEWVPDDSLPMEKLSRYHQLVSAEWLQELISGGRHFQYNNDKYVMVHADYRNRDAYLTGHVPGAVFADCGSDAYHMENYRNFDHTILEAGETSLTWYAQGITPEKHLAFYCGAGWRGSEAWFNAWLMAWSRVSVYDGGWF